MFQSFQQKMANKTPMTSPSDLQLLSLDFEKKLLKFQLEQEKMKSAAARANVAPSDYQEKIEKLQRELKEKENIIANFHTQPSSSNNNDNNVINNNNNAIENPSSQCEQNASEMAEKIKDLEQKLASCIKDKDKIALQLQTNASEKHNYLGLNFKLTMEKQSMQMEKDKLNQKIEAQKTEIETISKKQQEEVATILENSKGLQSQLQSNQSVIQKLSSENEQLKKELNVAKENIAKIQENSRIVRHEYDVKLENLNVNLESKTSQIHQQEKVIQQLRKDLQNHENGGKFKSVCTEIQELGKNMQLLLDSQFEEKERKISALQSNLKDFRSCSICFEEMESNGDHRSVSLPCGHLFGNMMNNNYEYRNPYQPTRQEFAATLVPPVCYIDLTDDVPQEYSLNSTTTFQIPMVNPIDGQFNLQQTPYVINENRTSSNLNGFQTVIPNVDQIDVNSALTHDNGSFNNLLKHPLDFIDDNNVFSILGELNSTFPNSRSSGITTQTPSDSSITHFQRDYNEIKMKIMKLLIALKSTINGQKKTISELKAQVVNEKQLYIFRAEEQKQRSDQQHQALLRQIHELGKKLNQMQILTNENHNRKYAQLERLLEEVKSQSSGTTQTVTQSSNPFTKWKCSICWDPEASIEHHPIVALSCGHIFHNSCIQRARQDSHQCPLCKQPFNSLTKLFVG
ncbi:putative leucine-rich repeat-containing protein DDB_G0290503 [Drosophila tropicalis]|uniref:putative leucine-rich repeat-containing protein DDB_G0290503 n=1 Tax=Drosophila tropicalis TaxID=46794 RepID=UPI0035ABF6C2